jgi:hypothetical protein
MSMYNAHRGMGPAPGNARLNELLDGVRQEFESQARASGEYEHSSMFTSPPLPMWLSQRACATAAIHGFAEMTMLVSWTGFGMELRD